MSIPADIDHSQDQGLIFEPRLAHSELVPGGGAGVSDSIAGGVATTAAAGSSHAPPSGQINSLQAVQGDPHGSGSFLVGPAASSMAGNLNSLQYFPSPLSYPPPGAVPYQPYMQPPALYAMYPGAVAPPMGAYVPQPMAMQGAPGSFSTPSSQANTAPGSMVGQQHSSPIMPAVVSSSGAPVMPGLSPVISPLRPATISAPPAAATKPSSQTSRGSVTNPKAARKSQLGHGSSIGGGGGSASLLPTPSPSANIDAPPPEYNKRKSDDTYNTRCNIYVASMPRHFKDEHLAKLFSTYGPIVSAKVMCDHTTRTSKGYGFVLFKEEEGARAAVEGMAGHVIDGLKIQVRWAHHDATPTSRSTDYAAAVKDGVVVVNTVETQRERAPKVVHPEPNPADAAKGGRSAERRKPATPQPAVAAAPAVAPVPVAYAPPMQAYGAPMPMHPPAGYAPAYGFPSYAAAPVPYPPMVPNYFPPMATPMAHGGYQPYPYGAPMHPPQPPMGIPTDAPPSM